MFLSGIRAARRLNALTPRNSFPILTSPSNLPSNPITPSKTHSTPFSTSPNSLESTSDPSTPTTPTIPTTPLSTTTTFPPSPPKTIFSGIQPTGIPHLGNYLGALRSWVHLQNTAGPDDKLLFSIVDLHALTGTGKKEGGGQDARMLMRLKRETLASLLAVGLDHEKCVVFCQSEVPAHEKLMWLLSCTASMGYLERMTQWKSKMAVADDASAKGEDKRSNLKLGLFSYPVLQAADILLHRATHVPVGEDQAQHLEFARECVTKFNQTVEKPILIYPETILSPAKRIKSLTDPLVKMSKSDPNSSSRIVITESPAGIHRKIMAAVTDSQNLVTWDPINRPGVTNLLTILFHFLPPESEVKSVEELGKKYEEGGMRLGEFKKIVADRIERGLRPIRMRYAKVMAQKEGRFLDHVALMGADRARRNAEETMRRVGIGAGMGWKMWDGQIRIDGELYDDLLEDS